MRTYYHSAALIVLPALAGAIALGRPTATTPTPAPGKDLYRARIAPYLAAACGGCHGKQQTSGLNASTLEGLLRGGKAGPAIVPGKAAESPLVQYLRGKRSPAMPLGGHADPAMVTLIERWIDAGALVDGKAPARPTSSASPAGWPYRLPARTAPPKVANRGWIRNPIDAFVLAKLEAKGLQPAPEAAPGVLLRRACFDLLGMPPTPEMARQFLADRAPGAYERLIDRLLASPHYGERWARFWLDLARYADTNGYEGDEERGFAWRYRDYVIRSFNTDKPFNRFLEEQIAGDELWPTDPDALIATGFLRNGPWDSRAFDRDQQRSDLLTDITDTTASVFLGLTVGCARCHNHKYDPIPQKDYYRLQAFFNQIRLEDRKLPGEGNAQAHVVVDAGAEAPAQHVLLRGDIHTPGEEVQPGVPSALAPHGATLAIERPVGGASTGRRSALARWLASADNPQTARVIVNRVWQQHFGRGIVGTPSDFGKNGDRPSHPELLDWLAVTLKDEGGRMKDEMGKPSSSFILHPFDKLRAGSSSLRWSLKSLTRLIVTSATYRQSTRLDARAATADPENRLLWRMNRRRLTGEEIRDAVLTVSGRLNPKMGGPGVFPPISREVLDTGSTHKWGASSPEEQIRRTIYVSQRRSVVLPLVDVFDGADMNATCPRRAVTTIAPQALSMLNGDFTHEEAGYFADRVLREAGPAAEDRIARAFQLAFNRAPSTTERQTCRAFLDRQAAIHRRSPRTTGQAGLAAVGDPAERAALVDLCHVLLNTNEFIYVE